jgi:hypothetical protein
MSIPSSIALLLLVGCRKDDAMERSKIRFGFRGKRQVWLFGIWREYWYDGKVVFAVVIFTWYPNWLAQRDRKLAA